MALLTELPPEIIHNVLRFVDPPDLAWIPRVCRTLYYLVSGNTTLFKHVYLAHFDTPPSDREIAWEQCLQDAVRLQLVCRQGSIENKRHQLPFVHDTVTQLLRNASSEGPRASRSATHSTSLNATLLAELFSEPGNQHAFLARSFIFERARGELPNATPFSSPPREEHQMGAKLHCLYGVPLLHSHRGHHVTRQGRMAPFACSKVYDMRQYTDNTKWGPFMDDDTDMVDWEKVEAIMIVLGSNLRRLGLNSFPICKNFWDTPFAGVWPGSYKVMPILEREKEENEPEDPYGITGTWLRVVCFLDYNDFFSFNFTSDPELPSNVPRRAIDYGEATRLILMKIHVTKIEPPGPEDGQELPVAHFTGISRSLEHSWDENADSDLRGRVGIKGIVRLTREGEVRWTTWSVFNGQERWRSESVQVGGVKSAKGVLGHWFDKDFDPRGPAGPTAFWKISDQVSHLTSEHHVLTSDYEAIEAEDNDYEPSEGEGQDDEDEDGDDDDLNMEEVEIEFIIGSEIELSDV